MIDCKISPTRQNYLYSAGPDNSLRFSVIMIHRKRWIYIHTAEIHWAVTCNNDNNNNILAMLARLRLVVYRGRFERKILQLNDVF